MKKKTDDKQQFNGLQIMNSMNYMMFGFCDHRIDPKTKICKNCGRDFQ